MPQVARLRNVCPSGGLAFGLRNFWQSHPTQLDLRNAATDEAEVTLWLWSREARAMDLRFYHDGMGMDTYEEQLEGLNYEPEFGTPHGIRPGERVPLSRLRHDPGAGGVGRLRRGVLCPATAGGVARPADRSGRVRQAIQ